MKFVDHGSKNFVDLKALLNGKEKDIWDNGLTPGDQACYGRIILHDQEPFSFSDSVYTYKRSILNNKFSRPDVTEFLDPAKLFTWFNKFGLQTILCHSEINSPDIEFVVKNCAMIDCYYWYHAMIARDWFRHWQHHPDLLPGDRSKAPYRFIMYARDFSGTRTYRKRFIEHLQPLKQNISYNWEHESPVSSDYSAKIDIDDANIGAIHIVLETLFETSKIHLTEKVFKPMVMSQPFFLLAGPGSLRYLRKYGFQTFSDFWDESYDNINDAGERMQTIEKEIARLASMPQIEFSDLYNSMLPVIEHNRRRFFSQEFQDHCVQEMWNNFDRALELQEKNRMVYPGGPWLEILEDILNNDVPISDRWHGMVREFLLSTHLSVPVEKILQTYPLLSRYLS